MATFKIEFDCDNAAFDDAREHEIARILRTEAKKIAAQSLSGYSHYSGIVRDINGNTIGHWDFNTLV